MQNFLWFQINWFGLVYLQNAFIPVTFGLLTWHFYHHANSRRIDGLLGTFFLTIGILVESVLQSSEVITFSDGVGGMSLVPPWLLILWFTFGLTIEHSMKWGLSKPLFTALIGGLLAPLSYLVGVKSGAASLAVSFTQIYLMYAPIWAMTLYAAIHFRAVCVQHLVTREDQL